MNVSILHISDLHRDPDNPISNQALLDSLENDRRRYSGEENPAVRSPDIIVVSGDVIQGVSPGTSKHEKKLQAQYGEALAFLNKVTERFLGGDKRRIVIVPGNHDVSACHFVGSVRRIDLAPGRKKELVTQLFSPNSTLRWSWMDFELYEIEKEQMYADRLAAFCDFYAAFYDRKRIYSLNPAEQFDVFDFPEFNLTVVAFSSCHNNDIFNKQGSIHPDSIAAAGMRLREIKFDNRLRMAVWHHNTEGLPLQSDYMDPDVLQNLIDRGFSLGFHGHQHRPQFLDTRFRHEGNRRITVISAGTLCGGASARFARAYNLVELDTERRTGKLHVREMQNDNLLLPIWGRRPLPPNIGSCLEFEFEAAPEPVVPPDLRTTTLMEAQRLHESGEYRLAAEMLAEEAKVDDLARRLRFDCFVQLHDDLGIIDNFDPPKGVQEAVRLMDALWAQGRRERLADLLGESAVAKSGDGSIIDIRKKYAARLKK
jgi:predicted MPP superfamily phosphohydrolase